MTLRDIVARKLCDLFDDEWSEGKDFFRSEATALLALIREKLASEQEDKINKDMADQEIVDLLDQVARLTGKVAQLEYQASWAATEERARIVAWLRGRMNDAIMSLEPVPNIDDLADEIEDGRHLK
jgi:hypothetical protein